MWGGWVDNNNLRLTVSKSKSKDTHNTRVLCTTTYTVNHTVVSEVFAIKGDTRVTGNSRESVGTAIIGNRSKGGYGIER